MRSTATALILAAGLAMLAASCATTVNPQYDRSKPHHTPTGFRNNYVEELGNDRASFWKWQWERLRAGLPRPPANGYAFPIVAADVPYLKANRSERTATWIGHATVLLQIGGVNILTDPHLTARASPVSFAGPVRKVPPALMFEELPRIDVVVISHNHYDHLDEGTVRRLAAQSGGGPRFLVPLGVKAWFTGLGIMEVDEFDWWDRTTFGGVEFHFTPAQHWSARSWTDRSQTLWGGWYMRGAGMNILFAGDTGYSKDFQDIATRLGRVDFAMLPIGAYEPRWFMRTQHVDPAEAVRIHQDLGAHLSLGVHWGTFEMTDEPLDEPPKKLAMALKEAAIDPARFVAVRHGETLRLSPR